MRRTLGIVVTLGVMLVSLMACSDDDDAGTVTTRTTTAGSSTDGTRLVGTTDLDPGHWRLVDRRDFTVRVFGDQMSLMVGEWEPVMNGCGLGQIRVRWRSLGSAVTAGITGLLDPGMEPQFEQQTDPSTEGSMVMSHCEQPVWQGSDNLIVDLAVDLEIYEPSA
jgi:hypothetical protein